MAGWALTTTEGSHAETPSRRWGRLGTYNAAEERFRATNRLIEPYVRGHDGEHPGHTFLSAPGAFDEAAEQLVTHAHSRAQAVSEFLAAAE